MEDKRRLRLRFGGEVDDAVLMELASGLQRKKRRAARFRSTSFAAKARRRSTSRP